MTRFGQLRILKVVGQLIQLDIQTPHPFTAYQSCKAAAPALDVCDPKGPDAAVALALTLKHVAHEEIYNDMGMGRLSGGPSSSSAGLRGGKGLYLSWSQASVIGQMANFSVPGSLGFVRNLTGSSCCETGVWQTSKNDNMINSGNPSLSTNSNNTVISKGSHIPGSRESEICTESQLPHPQQFPTHCEVHAVFRPAKSSGPNSESTRQTTNSSDRTGMVLGSAGNVFSSHRANPKASA